MSKPRHRIFASVVPHVIAFNSVLHATAFERNVDGRVQMLSPYSPYSGKSELIMDI